MAAKRKRTARLGSSRSKEFDLMFGYLEIPEALQKVVHSKHGGAKKSLEGIVFEYGNITRFRNQIGVATPKKPFDISPVYIGHIDSIPVQRRRELEIEFAISEGTLSDAETKIDLLIVDANTNPYLISFKDSETTAKLGQVSKKIFYGDVCLEGGIDASIISGEIPQDFGYSETALTSKGFQSISRQNRQFAWFKKNHPREWESYASSRLSEAYLQVRSLGLAMQSDHEIFFDFLEKTFAGSLANNDNFYLVIGNHPIHFRSFMKQLRNMKIAIEIEDYQVQAKKSLIVYVHANEKKYCVTKIEPSFEGADKKVLQTKGVVFHFQQHLKTGNNYKQLLFDVAE